MRKKFMAGMLAATLAMGMNTAVFATEGEVATEKEYKDESTATLQKTYTLTNAGTTSPAETFSFSRLTCIDVTNAADGVTKENAPVPTIENVSYDGGEAGTSTKTKDITITLQPYTSVGIYTYEFGETNGKTAGVTYRENEIKLVVTVINGEDGLLRVAQVHTEEEGGKKTNLFENTYSAGSLEVKKVVTGKMGDKTKDFTVKVTFKAKEGTKVKSVITYTDGDEKKEIDDTEWSEDGTATAEITLKNDETVTFNNIPYGVTYTVEEDNYTDAGYIATYSGTDGSNGTGEMNNASESVMITNNKEGNVDTGINLDSMPYLMMMGVACAGMFTFFTKKRMARED